MLLKIPGYSGISYIHTSTKTSRGALSPGAWRASTQSIPAPIPDLLRLFCEDTTLAKLDMDKIRIETPSYIAGKKNLHCDLVVSAPFRDEPERKVLFSIKTFFKFFQNT